MHLINRLSRRRWIVAAVPIAMAAGLVVAVQAPAQAYTGTQALTCEPFANVPAAWSTTHTLTVPASAQVGDTFTVTEKFATGPDNGPVPIAAGVLNPSATVLVSVPGGTGKTVTLTGTAYGAIPANSAIPGATLTGSFTVATAGTTTFTVQRFVFDATAVGVVIPCDAGPHPKSNPPVNTSIIDTVNVTAPSSATATITSVTGQASAVTGYVRPGNTINLSASGFAPNGTLTVKTCDTSGSSCDAGTATATLNGNGDGTAALGTAKGSAFPPPGTPGITVGSRAVSVSDGTTTKLIPVTVLGAAVVSITPSGGGAGTTVTIKGTNFDPGAAITYGGFVPAGGIPPVTVSADPNGSGTTNADGTVGPVTFTVHDPATTYVGVIQGAWSLAGPPFPALYASAPFTASAGSCTAPCSLKYNLSQAVKAGALTMSRTDDGNIAFSDVTTSATAQQSTGSLAAVTVSDLRGGTLGWSLVGSVTDFTSASKATIPATNLSWTPTCVVTPGDTNMTTAQAGSNGPVGFGGTASTLCSSDANTAGTGGSWDASAAMTLAIPAFQQAGDYSATLTLSLS